MYRAVALAALEAGVDLDDADAVARGRADAPTSSSSDGRHRARRPRRVDGDPRAATSPARCRRCRRIPRCARCSSTGSGRGSRSTAAEWWRAATSAPSCSPTRRSRCSSPPATTCVRPAASATRRRRHARVDRRRRAARRYDRATGPTRTLGRATRPEDAARRRDASSTPATSPPTTSIARASSARAEQASGRPMTLLPVRPRRRAQPVQGRVPRAGAWARSTCRRTGAYIVAPSHRSILDVPFAAFITDAHGPLPGQGRPVRDPARVAGCSTRWARCRSSGAPPTVPRCARWKPRSRAGTPVAVFPEGTRSSGPEIARAVRRAPRSSRVKFGVPIVPVGIGGSEHILPKGKLLPRIHRVAVSVGRADRSAGARGPRPGAPRRRSSPSSCSVELQRCFDDAERLAR